MYIYTCIYTQYVYVHLYMYVYIYIICTKGSSGAPLGKAPMAKRLKACKSDFMLAGAPSLLGLGVEGL